MKTIRIIFLMITAISMTACSKGSEWKYFEGSVPGIGPHYGLVVGLNGNDNPGGADPRISLSCFPMIDKMLFVVITGPIDLSAGIGDKYMVEMTYDDQEPVRKVLKRNGRAGFNLGADSGRDLLDADTFAIKYKDETGSENVRIFNVRGMRDEIEKIKIGACGAMIDSW